MTQHDPPEKASRDVASGNRFSARPIDPYTERLDCLLRAVRLRDENRDGFVPPETIPKVPQARALREHILSRVERLKALPSPPEILGRLDQALAAPRVDAKIVADVIQYDPALAAKVLSLVNSAAFGLRSHVERIDHAVALVGVDTIRTLVLAVSVFRVFDPKRGNSPFDLNRFWEHSITVALGSRLVARSMSGTSAAPLDPNLAFLAGLLHDVGKIVIAQHFAEDYTDIRALAQHSGVLLYDAELAVLGIRHTDIGHRLLSTWGLPEALTTAVRFHHEPGSAGKVAYVVHLADLIAHGLGQFPEVPEVPRLDPLLWVELDLSDEVIESVSHQILDGLAEVRKLFVKL